MTELVKQYEKDLRRLGVPMRDRRFGVGKRMGTAVWVHRDYAEALPVNVGRIARDAAVKAYDVVRWDSAKETVCYLSSPDFATAHEPTVGASVLVKPDGSVTRTNPPHDPLIWHHKWTMVRDDCALFDVEQAIMRSIEWKERIGRGAVSSKIGRLSFWDAILKECGLPARMPLGLGRQ